MDLADCIDVDELPTETPTIECPFDVERVKDPRTGKDVVYGEGAWSTVYKAIVQPKIVKTHGLVSPPASPFTPIPLVVAVKTPARRDARPILQSEAETLFHISKHPCYREFVVPFYGIQSADHSLVLGALPHSLEDEIRACSRTPTTSAADGEPILAKSRPWLSFAHQCISALAWLHETAHVIHGDLKPGNILLAPSLQTPSGLPYRPILADFSSSQRIASLSVTPNTLSALTLEYTAPELLRVSVMRDPLATATPASDVFSLAVTLVASATGNLSVYEGSGFQRRAMATQGWGCLGFVRNGESGGRVPRFGVVERVVERGLLREGIGRVQAPQWRELVEGITRGEPAK